MKKVMSKRRILNPGFAVPRLFVLLVAGLINLVFDIYSPVFLNPSD